jgi:hypothetical protein
MDRHHQRATEARCRNTDGTPLDRNADPHLITDFEKLVELRNSLQPDSRVHDQVLAGRLDGQEGHRGFIGVVISGGAGLATLGL